jgi:hypothetical protein
MRVIDTPGSGLLKRHVFVSSTVQVSRYSIPRSCDDYSRGSSYRAAVIAERSRDQR